MAFKMRGWVLPVLMVLSSARAGEPLTASGCSISMVGYLNDLVKAYEQETGQKILVRGGGSSVGLSELGADRVDFAASCKSRGKEDPASLKFIPVAWDALVFIVNPANKVDTITVPELRAIYEGRIANWKELGGQDLPLKSYISTPMGMAGIGETLSRYVLADKMPQTTANSSMQSASVALWEQMVEKNTEGFASTGFDSAQKRKVRMLAVNGVAPSRATIVSGRYPFKRPLFLVTPQDPKPEVEKFVKFALSPKGQKLIASYGTIPLAALR